MSGASGSGAAAGFDSDGSRDDKQTPQRISVEEVRLWEGKKKEHQRDGGRQADLP